MKRFLWIVIAIAICMCVGYTAHIFQEEALLMWYPSLDKPSLTPPNSVFPIAWGIIYVCMGLSSGILCNIDSERKRPLILLFIIQLMLNFLWSISFFYLQSPLFGLINIVLLDYLAGTYIYSTYKVKRLSAWLFLPYALWLVFATYLNTYIFVMN